MTEKISYVLPVYNEELGIEKFHQELIAVVESLRDMEFEFIYVNDGSRDGSLSLLRSMAEGDPRIRVIDFSRNYGHQIAITAGIDAAHGDAVIIMDTDLQDPPAVSLRLIDAWREGADVAYAQRKSRQDGVIKKLTARVFYRFIDSMSDIDLPRDTGDFRLMSRRAVDALKQFREKNRYVRGLVTSLGFKQVAVEFDRDARFAGETAYTWNRMIRLASDGIVGFSSKPLDLILNLGLAISGFSLLLAVYAIVRKIFFASEVVEGWAFLATGIFFLGGVQLITIGLVGAYVSRIYAEVQNRPLYLVQGEYGSGFSENHEVPRSHMPSSETEQN